MSFIERIPAWVWIAIIAHLAVLGTVAYLILLERKIASWVQDRLGPNRVGPGGLLQPIADGFKFFFKEDYRPAGVDRKLFTLAPALMIAVIIMTIAVLPWGGTKQTTVDVDITGAANVDEAVRDQIPFGAQVVGQPQIQSRPEIDETTGEQIIRQTATVTYRYPFMIADLNIGVLFIVAFLSLAVYGVVIGGWASNNKYSFLGGLRATANMISYEVPLGMMIITVAMMFGTLRLSDIVEGQAHYWMGVIPAWNVFCQPLAFVLFLVCIHAEANRAPFDTAEAEQELVGGYHTEYSSMRFALFFLAEYAGMVTTSAVCVALFFGGWHLPWLEWAWAPLRGDVDPLNPGITTSIIACVIRAIVFFTKTLVIIAIFMWVRWSLPRFRFDQILTLAWRALIPISLFLMMATAVTIWVLGPRFYLPGEFVSGRAALALLVVNIGVIAIVMGASLIVPAAPPTNRKIAVAGSRFASTVPATT
jgi:NADH-quinone oxidoreductase subunit H